MNRPPIEKLKANHGNMLAKATSPYSHMISGLCDYALLLEKALELSCQHCIHPKEVMQMYLEQADKAGDADGQVSE